MESYPEGREKRKENMVPAKVTRERARKEKRYEESTSATFLADHSRDMPQFVTPLISKLPYALGLGSLICLLAFLTLGAVYRPGTGSAAGGKPTVGHETLRVAPGQAGHRAFARQA